MADYYPLVARAVAGLEENSGEARRALYERARAALVKQLRGISPSLTESEITRERLALEEAIRKVEAEQARRSRSERAAAAPADAAPAAAEQAHDDSASSAAAASAEAAASAVAAAAASESAAPPPPDPPAAMEPRPRRRRPEPPPAEVVADRPPEPPSPPRDIAAEQTEAALRALRERLAAAGSNRAHGGGGRPGPEPVPESAPAAAVANTVAKEPPGDMVPPLGDDEGYDVHQPPAAARRRSGAALKIVIAVVILAVLGAVGAVGYRQRDRLVALYHAFTGQQTVASRQPAEKPKIEDRIGPATQPTPGNEERQTPQPVQPPPAVAQRVVLYEEDPKDPNGKRFVGSVIWRTETVSPGSGLAPELAVKATVEVPERHFQMTFSMVRNTDPALPASHTIDIRFTLPPNFPGGGVANVPGILMKQTEQTRGVPLAGLAVKVTNNVFLIGLSAVDTDVQRNTQLLKDRAWFDIPIVYSNGSRAILAMEKGTPGERAFDEAFTAWGQAGTAAR